MSLSNPTVAIVGATGAVGSELIACLEQRNFPLSRLRLFASARSAGRAAAVPRRGHRGRGTDRGQLPGRRHRAVLRRRHRVAPVRPMAVRQGAVVVDNSSAFRMEPGVPLVVPEVNREAISRHLGIIANPNCVAIVAVMPLWPLHRHTRHPPRDRRDLPGGVGRRCGGNGGAARLHRGHLAGEPTQHRAGASLRVQPVQPRHAGGPGDRLQRGGDQGHAGTAQDHGRAGPARSVSPACACRCCARTRSR